MLDPQLLQGFMQEDNEEPENKMSAMHVSGGRAKERYQLGTALLESTAHKISLCFWAGPMSLFSLIDFTLETGSDCVLRMSGMHHQGKTPRDFTLKPIASQVQANWACGVNTSRKLSEMLLFYKIFLQ